MSAGTSGACLYNKQAEGKWHGSAKIIDIIIIIIVIDSPIGSLDGHPLK
jgi:hypothetical protein